MRVAWTLNGGQSSLRNVELPVICPTSTWLDVGSGRWFLLPFPLQSALAESMAVISVVIMVP